MQEWVPLCFNAVGCACLPSQAKLSLTQLFLLLFISAVLTFPLVNVPFAFTYHKYFKLGLIWPHGREVVLVMVPEPCGRGWLGQGCDTAQLTGAQL